MKNILLSLLTICSLTFATSAQMIYASPDRLNFTAPSGAYAAPQHITLSASGLIPASGSLIVTAPIKFAVSFGGVYNDTAAIPYTGGTLPSTDIYVQFALANTGFADHDVLSITGGGLVGTGICMCAFMPSCPCTTNIPPVANDAAATITPNPAFNNLTITSAGQIRNIAIANIMGQVLLIREYNSNEVQVDVAGLPAGIYLLRINGTEVRRFVKE